MKKLKSLNIRQLKIGKLKHCQLKLESNNWKVEKTGSKKIEKLTKYEVGKLESDKLK